MASASSEFWRAVRLVLPPSLGNGTWGLVTGIAMMKAGLTIFQAGAMSLLVYAGSAQLATLPLLAGNAPLGILFLTATVVNLRFVIYAMTMAPWFSGLPRWSRLALGYVGGDIVFVFFSQRVSSEPQRPHRFWFYGGACAGTWACWQIGSFLGILLGSQVPPQWGLEFAATLALLALALPLLRTRPALAGFGVTGLVALLSAQWPFRLGLVASIIAGVATSMVCEHVVGKPPGRPEPRAPLQ